MMRKILLPIAVLAIIGMLAGCGGGGGEAPSSSQPPGVNAGIPSIVQLLDVQSIVQTNSYVDLRAKVLDGNGVPVPNEAVTFTNLSHPFGTLMAGSVSSAGVSAAQSVTVAYTDSLGFARIRLFATSEGFATIIAQVNIGTGVVRDRITVFFTSSMSFNLTPTMTLEVDGDADGTYNEASDFILFETQADSIVVIRATVFSPVGLPVFGSLVTFTTDAFYAVGGTCLFQGTCEVDFISNNLSITNSLGQAFTTIRVTPESIRQIQTLLTVFAVADNGAFNALSLLLNPIIVTDATLQVFANPSTMESEDKSNIVVRALTTAGIPVPDGTIINIGPPTCAAVDCGGIAPFTDTDADGIAEEEFTAPTVTATNLDVHIGVSVFSAMGGVTVTVTPTPPTLEALKAAPTSGTIDCTGAAPFTPLPATLTFIITGGDGNYTATSTNPGITTTVAGNTLTVQTSTGDCSAFATGATTTVNIIIQDGAGTAPITVAVSVKVP
jgi:hypothetical protein